MASSPRQPKPKSQPRQPASKPTVQPKAQPKPRSPRAGTPRRPGR